MDSPKPFHESIVDAVNGITFKPEVINSRSNAAGELERLVLLTLHTVIPGNHDAIAEAFRKKMEELYVLVRGPNADLFVHIESEKIRAETGNDLKEPLYGEIKALGFDGRSAVVELDQPQGEVKYAVINDETRGRIQLMNQNEGSLKRKTRVKIVSAQRGSEAFMALEVAPV